MQTSCTDAVDYLYTQDGHSLCFETTPEQHVIKAKKYGFIMAAYGLISKYWIQHLFLLMKILNWHANILIVNSDSINNPQHQYNLSARASTLHLRKNYIKTKFSIVNTSKGKKKVCHLVIASFSLQFEVPILFWRFFKKHSIFQNII